MPTSIIYPPTLFGFSSSCKLIWGVADFSDLFIWVGRPPPLIDFSTHVGNSAKQCKCNSSTFAIFFFEGGGVWRSCDGGGGGLPPGLGGPYLAPHPAKSGRWTCPVILVLATSAPAQTGALRGDFSSPLAEFCLEGSLVFGPNNMRGNKY